MGHLDEAIAKSKEALKIRPDYRFSLLNLIILYAVREQYEESMRWANEYVSSASSVGMKSEAYCQRGFYHYWRGKFKDALSDFDRADKMAEEAENWTYKANALEGKGILYLLKGEFELSRTAFENELKILIERVRAYVPFHKAYLAWRLGILAAEQGQIDVANAKLGEIREILPIIDGKAKGVATALGDLVQGEASLRQGDLDAALAAGQKACGPGTPFWSRGWGYTWPFNEYMSYSMDLTARVFAKKGDIAKAISEYERLLKSDEGPFLVHPLYRYRLGLLYERAGDAAKAKVQYQKFLDLWKDADPGRPEVVDAKARLAALKT